jgi:LmbE family N-acetylglucosaminyl deacetylase
MYLAFKKAIEEGIPVGRLWMRPKGWLMGDSGNPGKRGKPDVKIDVKDYVATKYEALNKHVSQKGTIRKQLLPSENVEKFITVIDNTR